MANCCSVSQWIVAFWRWLHSPETDSERAEPAPPERDREYANYIAARHDETDSSSSNPWSDLFEDYAPPKCPRMQEAENDWLRRGGSPYMIWRFDMDLPCCCSRYQLAPCPKQIVRRRRWSVPRRSTEVEQHGYLLSMD